LRLVAIGAELSRFRECVGIPRSVAEITGATIENVKNAARRMKALARRVGSKPPLFFSYRRG